MTHRTSFGICKQAGVLGIVCSTIAGGCSSMPPNSAPDTMPVPRVIGIGGVFFKSPDPQRLYNWYQFNLGLAPTPGEGHVNFCWRDPETLAMARTVWGPFDDKTRYFDPGTRDFMMNYRVSDLDGLLNNLRKKGVEILDNIEEYSYGRFAWIIDIDGNKVELWEPNEDNYPWRDACNQSGG